MCETGHKHPTSGQSGPEASAAYRAYLRLLNSLGLVVGMAGSVR